MTAFKDLPGDIITEIFRYFDQEQLSRTTSLFETEFEQENEIYKILETVKHSRIIVTNCWHDLLVLLIRAKKIVPCDQLPKYIVWSFEEFLAKSDDLRSKYYLRFKCPKKIIYAFGDNPQYEPEVFKILRHFSKFLKQAPSMLRPISREINIFFSENESIFSEMQHDVNSTFFNRVLQSYPIMTHLENLRLESDCQPFNNVKDFSCLHKFTALKSLTLSNLNFKESPNLILPQSLIKLKILNSSIKSIQGWVFPSKLKTLDLSRNVITAINGSILPPSLKTLILQQNKLDTFESLPNSLSELDMSLNNFSELDFDVPTELKILYTDWAQYYLMPKILRRKLMNQRVLILH